MNVGHGNPVGIWRKVNWGMYAKEFYLLLYLIALSTFLLSPVNIHMMHFTGQFSPRVTTWWVFLSGIQEAYDSKWYRKPGTMSASRTLRLVRQRNITTA